MVTLDEIQKSLTTDEYLVADKKRNLACVFRQELEVHEPTGEKVLGESRIVRLLKALPEGGYEEVNYENLKQFMKEFLKEKMNVDDFVDEVINTTPPDTLLQAQERLQDPKIRKLAKARNGCYAIVIPPIDSSIEGEKGKIMELFMR